MDGFGFSVGSGISVPAIVLFGLLGAIVIVWVLVALARGRGDDHD